MHLHQYKQEAEQELDSILQYWIENTIDKINGGFFGKIDNDNVVYTTAPKGAVLNARILWTFSAAYNYTKTDEHFSIAQRAFEYIRDHFIDKEYGGVYWTVDYTGCMLDLKKQVYAIAFCIYGLSEYYKASGNKDALKLAIELYNAIEKYSYDDTYKGYLEAFARDWSEAGDIRLSAKDANGKKTMNTHLHIIEAYANLYTIQPSSSLKNKITGLLELFDKYFIDQKKFHLKLFFDENWNEKPDVISYGHDIEAAWLLLQCAEIIQDEEWTNVYKQHAVKIANAVVEGLDKDGGLWYEYEPAQERLIKEKHWWLQAEAMIGFFNAYEISGNENHLQYSFNNWQFIKQYILDKENGEWYWGIKEDHSIMTGEDKAGLWKCPYHNARACLEIIKRIS